MFSIKQKIKMKLESIHPIYRMSRYIYDAILHHDRLSRIKRFGEKNPDIIIFVIRPNSEDEIQGLMSLFIQSMRWVDYAKRKGYVPFIDYKNYKTQYSDGNNIWNYFFTQPSNLTYDEVYSSKNVRFSGPMFFDDVDYELFEKSIFFDKEICKRCNYVIQNSVQLSKEANEHVQTELRIIDIMKCIGVYIRGTDYTALKPLGEFVQPTIDQVIERIDIFLSKSPDYNIFLVTEDQKNHDILKEKYGNKLVTVSSDYYISNYNGNDYLSKSNVLEVNPKKRGMDYLVKIVLLSKCPKIITSMTMGSIAAYALNGGKFVEEYVFNLGVYK